MVLREGWPPFRSFARSAFDSNETGVEPGGRTMDWGWLTGVGGATWAGRAVGVATGRLLPTLALVSNDEEEDDGGAGGEEVGGLDLSPRAMVTGDGEKDWPCPCGSRVVCGGAGGVEGGCVKCECKSTDWKILTTNTRRRGGCWLFGIDVLTPSPITTNTGIQGASRRLSLLCWRVCQRWCARGRTQHSSAEKATPPTSP